MPRLRQCSLCAFGSAAEETLAKGGDASDLFQRHLLDAPEQLVGAWVENHCPSRHRVGSSGRRTHMGMSVHGCGMSVWSARRRPASRRSGSRSLSSEGVNLTGPPGLSFGDGWLAWAGLRR